MIKEEEVKEALDQAIIVLLNNISGVKDKHIKDYVAAIDILLSKIVEEETILELTNFDENESMSDFYNKLKENKLIQLDQKTEINDGLTEALDNLCKTLAGIVLAIEENEE